MKLLHFQFYDKATGIFHPKRVATDSASKAQKFAAANAPEGHVPIAGVFDHLSQRVDIASGKVVDYQPPAPSVNHEWNAVTKRWQLNATTSDAQDEHADTLSKISQLNHESLSVMRDIALGNREAMPKLQAIEDQIQALQKKCMSIGAESNGR